jgi:formiminotetrahydrofolate cyclodeaminase
MSENIINSSVKDYLAVAASKASTPGGGSVAALSGALASTMASMVANFSIKGKKFEEVKERVEEMLQKFETIQEQLEKMVQADIDAYSSVSKAYSMPKETEEEKAARKEAIKEASNIAIAPPLSTAGALVDLSNLLPELGEIGNKNLISDTGVSALLCKASFQAALLNVKINLWGLGDKDKADSIKNKINEMEKIVTENCDKTIAMVNAKM